MPYGIAMPGNPGIPLSPLPTGAAGAVGHPIPGLSAYPSPGMGGAGFSFPSPTGAPPPYPHHMGISYYPPPGLPGFPPRPLDSPTVASNDMVVDLKGEIDDDHGDAEASDAAEVSQLLMEEGDDDAIEKSIKEKDEEAAEAIKV